MISLLNWLYFFRNCLILLPKSFFSRLDSIIISFIWSVRTPRLALSTLQLPLSQGGLSLPNFWVYYWAAILFTPDSDFSNWGIIRRLSWKQLLCVHTLPLAILSSGALGFTRESGAKSELQFWYGLQRGQNIIRLRPSLSMCPCGAIRPFKIWTVFPIPKSGRQGGWWDWNIL